MKAYKCDRCGVLFERKVKNQKYLATTMMRSGYLDLCEDCQRKFDKWFEFLKGPQSEDKESEDEE